MFGVPSRGPLKLGDMTMCACCMAELWNVDRLWGHFKSQARCEATSLASDIDMGPPKPP